VSTSIPPLVLHLPPSHSSRPDRRADSGDAATAASCTSPLAPIASSMRKTKDWLLRGGSPGAGARRQQPSTPPVAVTGGPRFRGTEGLDGEDNESLGGASGTGASALSHTAVSGGRLVSPGGMSDAGSVPRGADLEGFDVGSRDVRWDGWGNLSRVTPAPLSAVSERMSEDGSVAGYAPPRPGSSGGLSLTAQAVALQDAVNAGEASVVLSSSPSSRTVVVYAGSHAGSHAGGRTSGEGCRISPAVPDADAREERQASQHVHAQRERSQQERSPPPKFCTLM